MIGCIANKRRERKFLGVFPDAVGQHTVQKRSFAALRKIDQRQQWRGGHVSHLHFAPREHPILIIALTEFGKGR